MALLDLADISFGRGQRTLAEALSLSIAPGTVVHLTGPNGAGKTTLLEIAAGLRRPWQGRRQCHTSLHWLGHRNALAASLSPLQNLESWADLQVDITVSGRSALQALGVDRVRNRPCRDLSAGQKRRSALARLMMAQRPLWILDEPFDGLDQAGLADLADLFNAQTERAGAILVTSHQPLPARIKSQCVLPLQVAP
ncbi:MAG: heme ABC exporter ATP-binding protein CcmA [Polycyclovorans sp.]|tara:strand:- start:667 stop:1254 length:588 start_codon:yes stop_codon:yes gene_type:complete